MLLKELSEISSVSGNEGKIRKYIIEEIKDYVEEIKIDRIGNIVAYKKGNKLQTNKVMISAHIDEVGLMVNSIDSEGLIGFTLVGDIDKRILISKPVLIGEKEVLGVIGAKPIHLQKPEERKKALDYDQLYVDIGTSSKEETEKLVTIGDYISFKSDFREFGNNLFKGKALDNRSGVSVLIEILKEDSDRSFYAVFSVMKEIGIFGGQPANYSIKPDVNIIIDSSLGDNKLGKGPVLSFMERNTYLNHEITKEIIKVSKEKDIPFQLCAFDDDSSDASNMQTSGQGSKTIKISIPCKYRKSPVSLVNKKDLISTKTILKEVLNSIGGK